MTTTKSALAVAQLALEAARKTFTNYSCPKSPRKFTQPQLVACLVVKEFLRLDFRGLQQRLREWQELRAALALSRTPHFTTFCAAERRLLRRPDTDRLLTQVLDLCRRRGLLSPTSKLAAIDSTGMESRHVSHYFTRRSERHNAHFKARYPKLSAVCDTRSHLLLGITINRGPTVDHCEFVPTLQRARSRQPILTLLGDAGYDSEKAHRLCREQLGIRSIFPPRINGRPRYDGTLQRMHGIYRPRLRRRFPRKTYGQRWQIETVFSMLKRLLGAALRARSHHSQSREIALRVITLNLMILLRVVRMFYTEQVAPRFLGPSEEAAVD
jgi:hypothetical protein